MTKPNSPSTGPTPDGRTLAILALIGTSLIWGTAAVATKTALETFTPFVLACSRWLISVTVMLVVLARLGIRPVLDRRTVVLGFTGMACFNFFFSYGLERTSAANASLIGGALPVVIAIVSYFWLRERLAPIRWLGIIASMLGVALTVLGSTLDASLLGNALMFGSVLVWSFYSIYNREHLRGENPMAVTVGAAIFGLLFMLPLAGIEAVQHGIPTPSLSVALIVLYLSFGPSMGAILLWSFALTRVPASTAGVFQNVSVIVGIAAAGLLLDEPISIYHVIGAVLVIAGVLLTTYRRQQG